jgi:hypothetical protein
MSNEKIRERVKEYVKKYGTSYTRMGKDCGFGDQSYFLISKFMHGLNLKSENLLKIDKYLTERGC